MGQKTTIEATQCRLVSCSRRPEAIRKIGGLCTRRNRLRRPSNEGKEPCNPMHWCNRCQTTPTSKQPKTEAASHACLAGLAVPAPPLPATTKGRRAGSHWRPSGSLWHPWPSSCRTRSFTSMSSVIGSESDQSTAIARAKQQRFSLVMHMPATQLLGLLGGRVGTILAPLEGMPGVIMSYRDLS